MGEEQKKQEDNKAEQGANDPSQKQPTNTNDDTKKEGTNDGKEGEANNGEEKSTDEEAVDPPAPEEIMMRVFMHCEGCARKVQRCLRACDGVEDVSTDCRAHKVVVKGKLAAADPAKIAERLQGKTGRSVELLTPIPQKPEVEEKPELEETPKPEEKKERQVVAVVLKVHMHCEACTQVIKKRILKMKGVQTVEPELKASEVTVTGVLDAEALVDYVHRRTGKQAAVLKQEVMEGDKGKEEGEDSKEAKKGEEGSGDGGKKEGSADRDANNDGQTGGGEDGGEAQCEKEAAVAALAARLMEMRRNEMMYYYYQQQQHYPRYHQVEYVYPPQMFSDENPNACSVM